jgi:hypothetical protein
VVTSTVKVEKKKVKEKVAEHLQPRDERGGKGAGGGAREGGGARQPQPLMSAALPARYREEVTVSVNLLPQGDQRLHLQGESEVP